MNINEETNLYLEKKILIKKGNKYNKNYKIYFICSLVFILIINNLILILKLQHNEQNKIFYNYKKNELLRMCYKSRTLYYIQIREEFMKKIGMKYNENNLVSLNDKLNYLLIHESPDYKSIIADKIRVHEYSKKKLGKDICVPIIKIYKDANEIKLNELPNKFVLKCNHGSGMNIFCSNKKKFDIKMAKISLSKWIKIDYGFINNEFQYINIKRKIFAEKYLGENIEDYKVYCFNGNPKFIRVQKKLDNHLKVNNYYDLNWNLTDIETGLPHYYRKPEIKFERPKKLGLMIKYAKKLSNEFVFVRVDFYNINGNIYLSELTFSPSGMTMRLKNKIQNNSIGKLLDITKIKSYLYNN